MRAMNSVAVKDDSPPDLPSEPRSTSMADAQRTDDRGSVHAAVPGPEAEHGQRVGAAADAAAPRLANLTDMAGLTAAATAAEPDSAAADGRQLPQGAPASRSAVLVSAAGDDSMPASGTSAASVPAAPVPDAAPAAAADAARALQHGSASRYPATGMLASTHATNGSDRLIGLEAESLEADNRAPQPAASAPCFQQQPAAVNGLVQTDIQSLHAADRLSPSTQGADMPADARAGPDAARAALTAMARHDESSQLPEDPANAPAQPNSGSQLQPSDSAMQPDARDQPQPMFPPTQLHTIGSSPQAVMPTTEELPLSAEAAGSGAQPCMPGQPQADGAMSQEAHQSLAEAPRTLTASRRAAKRQRRRQREAAARHASAAPAASSLDLAAVLPQASPAVMPQQGSRAAKRRRTQHV